jgi:hypothetical protein
VAIEVRANDRKYYYRYHRTKDGRVVKEYIGSGSKAQFAADVDRQKRDERAEVRAAERREVDQINKALEPLAAFESAFDVLLQSALLASGFHNHKGQWR